MNEKDIMEMPYISFVMQLVDLPSVDYSKDKKEEKKPFGTPIKNLSQEDQNNLK